MTVIEFVSMVNMKDVNARAPKRNYKKYYFHIIINNNYIMAYSLKDLPQLYENAYSERVRLRTNKLV